RRIAGLARIEQAVPAERAAALRQRRTRLTGHVAAVVVDAEEAATLVVAAIDRARVGVGAVAGIADAGVVHAALVDGAEIAVVVDAVLVGLAAGVRLLK